MKLISVLGTGDYGECKYKLNRKESVSCCFIQTSLNSLENFDRTFLFLTKAAKQKNFEKLKQEFEKFSIKTNIEGIDIPDGRNEGELWDIFEIIEENIEEKEEVWFDITHSFRSIPLIFFLVLAYLRKVKNVEVKGLTYGAYEAKKNDVAPIIQLTPFVDLLDWITAYDRFINSGDATKIKDMLSKIQGRYYRNNISGQKPTKLQNFGKAVNSFHEASHLTRIEDVLTQGIEFDKKFQSYKEEIKEFAKPVELLLEELNSRIKTLSSDEPFSKEGMRVQLNLLDFYIETHQYVQAISLAREWIVSLVAIRNKWEPKGKEARGKAEMLLNATCEALKTPIEEIRPIPEMTEIYKIWGLLRDIRNDVDHCGMKEQSMSFLTLKNNIVKIIERLKETVDKNKLVE